MDLNQLVALIRDMADASILHMESSLERDIGGSAQDYASRALEQSRLDGYQKAVREILEPIEKALKQTA